MGGKRRKSLALRGGDFTFLIARRNLNSSESLKLDDLLSPGIRKGTP